MYCQAPRHLESPLFGRGPVLEVEFDEIVEEISGRNLSQDPEAVVVHQRSASHRHEVTMGRVPRFKHLSHILDFPNELWIVHHFSKFVSAPLAIDIQLCCEPSPDLEPLEEVHIVEDFLSRPH